MEIERNGYLGELVERKGNGLVKVVTGIREDYVLDNLAQILCSGVGSLTNPHKLVASLRSVQGVRTNDHAVQRLLDGLEDAFLFRRAGPSRPERRGGRRGFSACGKGRGASSFSE